MDNVGPIMDETSKRSGVTAQQVVQEVLSQTAGGQTGGNQFNFSKNFACLCCLMITSTSSLDPGQAQHYFGPDLDPNCLTH